MVNIFMTLHINYNKMNLYLTKCHHFSFIITAKMNRRETSTVKTPGRSKNWYDPLESNLATIMKRFIMFEIL